MRLLLAPRLLSSLETREKRLQEDWDQARSLTQSWETLKHDDLALLSHARGKSHETIHKALQEINLKKSKRLALLEEELALKSKKIRADLEKETHHILKNIEPMVSQIVRTTARRMLGQPLTQREIKKALTSVLNKSEIK